MARNQTKLKDIGKIPQFTYSSDAQVFRQANAGLSWTPIGALNAAVRVGQATPIMLYNSTSSVAFVNFGAFGVASTSSPATAIPLLPNSCTVLSSGPNDWVIASSASVYGYVADQDLT